MTEAYLGLGTNLGDRAANLRLAVEYLQGHPAVTVSAVSSIYETDPVGYTGQPLFLNAVAAVRTSLTPRELLNTVKKMEDEIGRQPSFRWGPRLIDIDILLYGDQIIYEADLIIPHQRLTERAFVLVPLAEIAPALTLPNGVCVREYLAHCSASSGIRFWSRW